jgi:hypothetical protein
LIVVALSMPGTRSFGNSGATHKRCFIMPALEGLVQASGLVELMRVGYVTTSNLGEPEQR